MDLVPILGGSLLELLEPHQVERQVERLQRFVEVVVEPGMVVEAVDIGTFLGGQAGTQLLEHWVEVEDSIGLGEVVEIRLKEHIINSMFVRHTILKVKFLSKNSILTKPQHFHELFTQFF